MRKILDNLATIRQNMADSSADWPNLGVPSASVAFRDVPRRPFVRSVVSHFPLPHLGVGGGAAFGEPKRTIIEKAEEMYKITDDYDVPEIYTALGGEIVGELMEAGQIANKFAHLESHGRVKTVDCSKIN